MFLSVSNRTPGQRVMSEFVSNQPVNLEFPSFLVIGSNNLILSSLFNF